jgi:hypothetical protein
MNIVPYNPLRWIEEHDRLVRRYLREHENERDGLTGLRGFFVRAKLEFKAWRHAKRELHWEKHDPRKLY